MVSWLFISKGRQKVAYTEKSLQDKKNTISEKDKRKSANILTVFAFVLRIEKLPCLCTFFAAFQNFYVNVLFAKQKKNREASASALPYRTPRFGCHIPQ